MDSLFSNFKSDWYTETFYFFTVYQPSDGDRNSWGNRMSFLWGKNSELVDAQKLRLNSGVCAAVHFSGDRVHNFYQMKMGTP